MPNISFSMKKYCKLWLGKTFRIGIYLRKPNIGYFKADYYCCTTLLDIDKAQIHGLGFPYSCFLHLITINKGKCFSDFPLMDENSLRSE